jgi:rhodanese-related sulfurtransferase
VVFICHSGARSDSVCRYLEENEGFGDLANLEGGIVAWHQAGLPLTR